MYAWEFGLLACGCYGSGGVKFGAVRSQKKTQPHCRFAQSSGVVVVVKIGLYSNEIGNLHWKFLAQIGRSND